MAHSGLPRFFPQPNGSIRRTMRIESGILGVMSTARYRWAILVLGVSLSVRAQGQPTPSPIKHGDPVQGTDELNGVRWFQLTMPAISIPISTRWVTSPAPTFELTQLPLYRWEIATSSKGPLSLIAFNQVQPAIELNCLSTVCEPKVERVLGIEGRINLGGRGAMPNNYLFIKREHIFDPIRNFSRLRIGFGGDLDL